MICPKCTGIMGHPLYNHDRLGNEWLEHRCQTCGYMRRTPTADANPVKPVKLSFKDEMDNIIHTFKNWATGPKEPKA